MTSQEPAKQFVFLELWKDTPRASFRQRVRLRWYRVLRRLHIW